MNYYSTNQSAPIVSLREAVVKGLAPDKGLYMPENIPQLPKAFFDEIGHFGLTSISKTVARAFFGEDIPETNLDEIVADTLRTVFMRWNFFTAQPLHSKMWELDLWHECYPISCRNRSRMR